MVTTPRKSLFARVLERRQGNETALARLGEYQRIHKLDEDDPTWEILDLHEDYLAETSTRLTQFRAEDERLWRQLRRELRQLKWYVVIAVLVLVFVIAVVSAMWARAYGWKNGYALGKRETVQALARKYDLEAAQWAMSPQGRQARDLATDDGMLGWAASAEAREMRRLGRDGIVQAALEAQHLAAVPRTQAAWLASDAGNSARAASDNGSLGWLLSAAGQQARAASKNGDLRWLLSEDGKLARTLSNDGTVTWLLSAEGRRARAFSADPFFKWVIDGFDPIEGPSGFPELGHLQELDKKQWMGWLAAVLSAGLLYDVEMSKLDPSQKHSAQCPSWTIVGYPWRVIQDGLFCEVWHEKVFFRLD